MGELIIDESSVMEEKMVDSPIECGYDPASINVYPFPSAQIPRLSVKDPRLYHLIRNSQPVVITDSNLVEPAMKWNLGYLTKNLGDGLNCVYISKNNTFKYFDNNRMKQRNSFKQPTVRHEMTFSQFVEKLRNCGHISNERVYLQQMLNDSVGAQIVDDFMRFNWRWVTQFQETLNWGDLSSNLLLVGQEGNITPVHYDEQENFFAQAVGYKRCILFSPDQFECLYPHPVSHPCDRQSQVDFSNPDYHKFPKFRNARACEAVVGPGDVLYIPMYWWHQIESLVSKEPVDRDFSTSTLSCDSSAAEIPPVTVSVNFWYKGSPFQQQIGSTLSAQQRISVMRNIEKMLGVVLGSTEEVGALLQTILEGRYSAT